ncbi:MAG: hypothetical protein U1E62_05200 [Alsobacter sp.]
MPDLVDDHMALKQEVKQLRQVVRLGVEMRAAQARYFRRDRTREDLIAAKQAEAAFDLAAKGVLG